MPKRPDFILRISIKNIEDFSPEAIVKSPRTFRPFDVQNACKNLNLEAPGNIPTDLLSLAHYIALDFFALAHSTGLYNRQIKLWESLARIFSIEVNQKTKGLFATEKLPDFTLSFLDHKSRPNIICHFAKAQTDGGAGYLKSCREFLNQLTNVQGLTGIFLAYPAPFPTAVLDFIRKETNAGDSIGRYESILPKFGVPVNLIELDLSTVFNPAEQAEMRRIRLVHPNLERKRPGMNNLQGIDISALDE